jgi:hypothetical protein
VYAALGSHQLAVSSDRGPLVVAAPSLGSTVTYVAGHQALAVVGFLEYVGHAVSFIHSSKFIGAVLSNALEVDTSPLRAYSFRQVVLLDT